MTYIKPHFGNLQKRAKALGLVITKMSDNTTLRSLAGIRHEIEQIEEAEAARIDYAQEGHPINPIPAKEKRHEVMAKRAADFLREKAHVLTGSAILHLAADHGDDYQSAMRVSMMRDMLPHLEGVTKFVTIDRQGPFGPEKEMRCALVTMTWEDYLGLVAILKEAGSDSATSASVHAPSGMPKDPSTSKALTNLIDHAKEHLAEMTKAEHDEMRARQRESFARGMATPCEHGMLDFEQCAECRAANEPKATT